MRCSGLEVSECLEMARGQKLATGDLARSAPGPGPRRSHGAGRLIVMEIRSQGEERQQREVQQERRD